MRLLDFFRRRRVETPPPKNQYVDGITPGDARERLRQQLRYSTIASMGWSWSGGVASSWTGEKYPGALNYAGLWNFNYEILRRRSRIAYWDSVQARALLGRLVENVVGHGLILEATPAWAIVNPKATEEERRAWTRDVETRFHLWASSKEIDASGRMNLYQLTRFAYLNILRDGEIIDILRYSPDKGRMNPLEIQFIRPEQMINPSAYELVKAAEARGNRILEGIEIDTSSKPVAYYIREELTGKDVRVPKYGPKSKRLFVSHSGIWDSVGQLRGIPLLAPLVHELQKLTDYMIAEIEATIINAVIAAYIKPSQVAPASRALAGPVQRGSSAEQVDAGDPRQTPPSTAYIDKPGLLVQTLKAGEDLASFDVKRPNVHFSEFVKAVKSSLSAALGIPVEVLDMSFNQNYSASRACLLLFWNVVLNWRSFLAADFLAPIYEAWMSEEISAGRIKAAGFETSVIRAAWLNCDWVGIPHPSIDPKAEAEASDLRTAAGGTTHERAAREYNGSEFSENVERLKIENEELAEAKKSMAPKPVEPAQIPPEDINEEPEPGPNGGGREKKMAISSAERK